MTPLTALSWSAPRLDDGDFAPEDPLAIDHLHQTVGNQLCPGFKTRMLRKHGYPPDTQKKAVVVVIEQAKRVRNDWARAA